MQKYTYPVVLTIAGSDSGGGAGIQADIKTISALGCFATTAITAVTVQNTLGVKAIHPVPISFVTGQIRAVMDDMKPAVIKIGMVHSAELAAAIAAVLRDYPGIPVILDPVMVASSGDRLISAGTVEVLKKELFPLSTLVTPNLKEASILADREINNPGEMKLAADELLKLGSLAVLVKGGHLTGPNLVDVYAHRDGYGKQFPSLAIDTVNTHGTGCSLSAAIAAHLAMGEDLELAIDQSITYIQEAILQGADVISGGGHGPLNHFFAPQKLIKLVRD